MKRVFELTNDERITAGEGVSREIIIEHITACLQRFTELWHERKDDGKEAFDLIRMLQADPNTANMVDDPLTYMGNIMLLIVGGNDTTRNSMSGGVLFLNQFPAQLAKVRSQPELIPSMVSEIIRYQTPLPHMRRTATRDVHFQGAKIRKGEKVVLWFVSGNYDDSISGQNTWTTSFTSFNRNGGSSWNSCQSLTYDSADVASGAVLIVEKDLRSAGGGGNVVGDSVNLIPNQNCNGSHKILCCR